MFYVDEATAVTTKPAMVVKSTPGYFFDGNPGSAIAATVVPDDWLNMVQIELASVLSAAGISPDQTKISLNQVSEAIATLITNGIAAQRGVDNGLAALDGGGHIPESELPAFTGDITTSAGSSATTLASIVGAGTYTRVTIDVKGRVTAGTSLASDDVTTALGYTPYSTANPAGYLTSAVTTFNARAGAVTLTGGDVTTALGYTPSWVAQGVTVSTITGTGAFVFVQRLSITVPAGGATISADALIYQSFATADLWGTYFVLDGATGAHISEAYAGYPGPNFPQPLISNGMFEFALSAGAHTIDLYWIGGPNVSLNYSIMNVFGGS